jgi:SAM-dependent methyltransferase
MRSVLEIRHTDEATTDWSQGAYEDIYTSDEIRHIDSFYEWLLSLLEPVPGSSLLDVACGVGVLPRLAEDKMQLNAFGVDFSLEALAIGHRESSKIGYVQGDGEKLPYSDNAFDYVTNIGSLEHYAHPADGVREMNRVLRPGGKACVLLPNTFGILGNVWTALRTGRTFDDGQPIQRYATRLEWQDLLESGGLYVVHTLKYERVFPRHWSEVFWYMKHPKDMVRMALSPLVPLNWADYFVYVCKKHSKE